MSTTSKQDRQGSRTPADLERKYDLGAMGDRFAEVMGIALDAQTHSEAALDAIGRTNSVVADLSQEVDRISITVKDLDNVTSAEFLIGVINGQSTAKISADRLDIFGEVLNIKVKATNIDGDVTADQIDANGLKLRNESGVFFVDIDAGIITVAGKQIFVQETVNDFPIMNFKAGDHYYAVCVRCSFEKHPDGTYDWIPWQFVFKQSDYQSL